VIYAKGGLFFDGLRTRLGDKTFLSVLRRYYAQFTFKEAGPDDLTAAFIAASSNQKATKAFVHRWLKSSHGDQDIDGIKFTTILRQLGGSGALAAIDPRLETALNHRGLDEFVKILKGLVSSDGSIRKDIDYVAVFDLLGQFLNPQEDELKRILGVAGRLIARGDKLRPGDVVREVGGALAGRDKQAQKLVQAFGQIFDAIQEMDTAKQGSK